jgi:hypothetical protein
MIVKVDLAAVRDIPWNEFALRFLAGGFITVTAGVIAAKWGPGVGGLFLAFPAIFPASATLVEKHERERKEEKGLHGQKRGTAAAAADAVGAAIGSLGLIAFATLCWGLIPRCRTYWVLPGAAGTWALVSVSAWIIHKRYIRPLSSPKRDYESSNRN